MLLLAVRQGPSPAPRSHVVSFHTLAEAIHSISLLLPRQKKVCLIAPFVIGFSKELCF
jgi:hypothetical protein